LVRLSGIRAASYGQVVTIAIEPESMDELIADCAQIPLSVRAGRGVPLAVPPAAPWTVNDACHAQVAALDEYV
jgi:hypothetical protein